MSINMEFCLFVLKFETYIGDEAKANDSSLTIEQGDGTTSKVVKMFESFLKVQVKEELMACWIQYASQLATTTPHYLSFQKMHETPQDLRKVCCNITLTMEALPHKNTC